jgi:hypothetical protein
MGGFIPFYKHHKARHTDNWDGHQLHSPDQEMQRDDDDTTGIEPEVSKAPGLGFAPAKSDVIKNAGVAAGFTPATADDRKYLLDSMEAEKR